ncbi:ABC transporter ATP-binding protein [Marinimicrococcus flavescens]|uniref:ABC transporter ATP-binding protein n=1 Tax=Marinimicrococcus flavescens TaxID=3031815 RepID=A0AAP3XS14_9PROT|nr:ABC transporter ATP-binding protein [Marinimicrococcus flavescens]
MSATMPPALQLEALSYAYARGRPALQDVSFSVPPGSFTALLGPNGAGKTTLLSLVTRLFQAPGGRVLVCGHDLRQAPRAALGAMGVVFQQLTLDLDLTVIQNLRYSALLHGLSGTLARTRIEEALARAGLEERGRTMVRALSGGMRRRLEIARGLLHEPRLLVLDEPTVGLDVDSRREIVAEVHAFCREKGLAVLWTTHLIDEVWPEDRLVVLHGGRVRAAGSVREVMGKANAGSVGEAFGALTRGKAA